MKNGTAVVEVQVHA